MKRRAPSKSPEASACPALLRSASGLSTALPRFIRGLLSEPVRGGRHHLRTDAHENTHRPRQLGAAVCIGLSRVTRFVVAHLRHDGATLLILHGKPVHVARQMLFHLPLGLDYEAEIGAVARCTSKKSDRE